MKYTMGWKQHLVHNAQERSNYDDPEPVKEAQPDGNANNQQYVQ